MKEDAEKRVEDELDALKQLLKAENLEVTEEEVNEELEKMASMYGMEAKQLLPLLGGNTSTIKGDLQLRKAIDFLVEHCKVVV